MSQPPAGQQAFACLVALSDAQGQLTAHQHLAVMQAIEALEGLTGPGPWRLRLASGDPIVLVNRALSLLDLAGQSSGPLSVVLSVRAARAVLLEGWPSP